jgi:hypothetical protein
VKWNANAASILKRTYETTNFRFDHLSTGRWAVLATDLDDIALYSEKFGELAEYNRATHDLAPLIEFSLAGKPIVERGVGISVSSAIDKFDDVRHIFSLPELTARGSYRGYTVSRVNFGEYQLFKDVNSRRAALYGPIIINLDITDSVVVEEEAVSEMLKHRRYREIKESPTRRGQFASPLKSKLKSFYLTAFIPLASLGSGLQAKIEARQQNWWRCRQAVCLAA